MHMAVYRAGCFSNYDWLCHPQLLFIIFRPWLSELQNTPRNECIQMYVAISRVFKRYSISWDLRKLVSAHDGIRGLIKFISAYFDFH